jgi:hypothetical protein
VEHNALSTYLNDHFAGATFGCDQARQLEAMSADTPFGVTATRLATEIEQDRDTLVELMGALEVSANPVKKAGAWIAEKAGRVKLSGASSNDEDLGRYLMLEALSLGVQGKASLWSALDRVSGQFPPLQAIDLAGLIARAEAQREALEAERLRTAEQALSPRNGSSTDRRD